MIARIWKWYVKGIKDSIEPEEYSHQVTMQIKIPKGEKQGRALVPCAIYAMDHSIDLNPSLIRKKDSKVMKTYPVGKKITYDSNEYEVVLTEEEKKAGVELEELERCKHCGQKVVISEVAQTRYRSCPDIWVTVGDPAKEELVVPVKFGFNKADVIMQPIMVGILILTVTWLFAETVFGWNFSIWLSNILPSIGPEISISPIVAKIIIGGILVALFGLIYIPRGIYKSYRLLSWYHQVKGGMEKNPYSKKEA